MSNNDAEPRPAIGPYLGLDLGVKRLGLAISDRGLRVASPLGLHKRRRFSQDAADLLMLVEQHQVTALILGLPLHMDGSFSPRAQSSKGFAHNLRAKAGFTLPIFFWDERLSSVEAERLLIEQADMTRQRRSQLVDKLAATLILQGFLDAANDARRAASQEEVWGTA